MSLYDINGNSPEVAYNISGIPVDVAYDIYGNTHGIFDADIPATEEDSYIEGRVLIFEDSFNGTAIDKTKWDYEIGYVRNNELQFYRAENVSIENSNLVITAKREEWKGFAWTSGSVHTNNLFEQTFGRFEAKIKFPGVVGSFPAFWLLGANLESEYHDDGTDNAITSDITWPQCGEADIVEMFPGNATFAQANLWSYSGSSLGSGRSTTINPTEYHVYAVEWTKDGMEMSVDGTVFKTYDFATLGVDKTQAYQLPMYIILNLAVGASGGTPASDNNEMKMYVDWVRVYAPF